MLSHEVNGHICGNWLQLCWCMHLLRSFQSCATFARKYSLPPSMDGQPGATVDLCDFLACLLLVHGAAASNLHF
jgi:hypothetical protein